MDVSSPTSYTSFSADDSPADDAVSSSSSSSSFSHIDDVALPCPLLDVIPPVRSLMLDYMDDLTAIRYLSTCSVLHAGYHEYPVKQSMTESTFRHATQLDAYFDRRSTVMMYAIVQGLGVFGLIVTIFATQWPYNVVLVGFFGAVIASISCYLVWVVMLRRRRDCCTTTRQLMWRRRYLMPRVLRLRTALWEVRLLPFLQHLTELTIAYDKDRPFGKKNPLPRSLRSLHLTNSPDLLLDTDTLPPRLKSLSLSAVKNAPVPAGVLPQSLTSLRLIYGFDTRWGIGEDVLPPHLQVLQVYEWTLPLSRIALPASLTALNIGWLSDHPLPVLPPHLEVLGIGGAFNQPLTSALPPSLRILQFTGHFDQPLTADVFASIPQLEQLWLSDHYSHQVLASMLPRSLHMLRLGKQCSLVIAEASDIPPQLRSVIVPAGWEAERMTTLQQLGNRHGLTVEEEAV